MIAPSDLAPLGLGVAGFVLGMRHATDADHVIAVTTIVSRERRLGAATQVGVAWGLGHMLTVVSVGGAIILFRISVPPGLAMVMELAVAAMLILLGLWTLAGTFSDLPSTRVLRWLFGGGDLVAHSHPHTHDTITHSHPHAHHVGTEHAHADHLLAPRGGPGLNARGALYKALGVGVVHGLAGSAAIALMVLAAIPEPMWALAYLLLFGLGTICGMTLITTAVGLPVVVSARNLSGLNRALAIGSGLISLGFGLILVLQYSLGS